MPDELGVTGPRAWPAQSSPMRQVQLAVSCWLRWPTVPPMQLAKSCKLVPLIQLAESCRLKWPPVPLTQPAKSYRPVRLIQLAEGFVASKALQLAGVCGPPRVAQQWLMKPLPT